jgi:hypothetical protein
MNGFNLSPQNYYTTGYYDVDTYTMGLEYVILAYLKVVHYFYGSVSSLNILAFNSFVFTRLVNYSIEYVLDVVFYIYYLSKIFHIYRNYDNFYIYSECPLSGFYIYYVNVLNQYMHSANTFQNLLLLMVYIKN